jgi:hypothetical protein
MLHNGAFGVSANNGAIKEKKKKKEREQQAHALQMVGI